MGTFDSFIFDLMPRTLVLASMGSGTTSLASELRGVGLQYSHDGVEGEEGSVSWIHILQLLPYSPSKIVELCESWESQAWHPVLFAGENGRYSKLCGPDVGDKYSKSRECWRGVCGKVLEGNMGCGNSKSKRKCDVVFNETVAVVRDPIKTINTLSHKFCPNQKKASSSGQLRVASVLLDFELKGLECWEGWARYWVEYYGLLLKRKVKMHRREGLDVCKLFTEENAVKGREKMSAFVSTGKWDDGYKNSRAGKKKKKKLEDMGEVGKDVKELWAKIKKQLEE
ncbi:hypothetical protein TL16_g06506 [Triparma laevis f. inornata]|uniref:Sulfotransferase n=2 Tax=Triparma laevis TaxID=1534972 RepID=A0A9W6ZDT9_9STRA|nr:hypothetical protein TrLO_g14016 [Triparma laevis f. longispina]GMH74597.1 hypothetical protein TL16_g06506 [Triparma laevis f. inornata]